MSATFRTETISFRFIDVPKSFLQKLEQGLKCELKVGHRERDTARVVAVFTLDPAMDFEMLSLLIKQNQIQESHYGIWISIVTEADSDGIHVPDYVVRLLRLVGGQLDFSFTSV
jgi:hypothetical protein